MRPLFLWGLVLITVWVQSHFLTAISGGGWIPNLVIILVAACAASRGWQMSLACGLWAGWWADQAALSQLGLRTVWFGLFALGVFTLRTHSVALHKPLVAMNLLVIGSGLYNLTLIGGLWLDSDRLVWGSNFGQLILVEGLLSGAVGAMIWRRLLSLMSTRKPYGGSFL